MLIKPLGYFLASMACNLVMAASTESAPDCMDNAKTQLAMNECAASKLAQANQELNRVYQAIQSKHQDDPVFLQKLKLAQRAWINFRDAQIDMIYPHRDDSSYYGSSLPMCVQGQLTTLTTERTKTLNTWLQGVEEGDVCAGSIKTSEM